MSQNSQLSTASSSLKASPKSLRWWISRFSNVGTFFLAGVLLIVLLGFAQRSGWISGGSPSTTSSSEAGSQETFTCPMHPQIRQPVPGRCPICGMALVPATSSGADLDDLAVRMTKAVKQQLHPTSMVGSNACLRITPALTWIRETIWPLSTVRNSTRHKWSISNPNAR